jgi:hypothetical protein
MNMRIRLGTSAMTLLAGALCACGMIRKDLAANGQAWNHLRPEHKEILKRWKKS